MMRITFNLLFIFLCSAGMLSFYPAIEQDIQREEVVFKNGDYVLSGTLVMPPGAQNLPVLIFMGGIEEWGDIHSQRELFIRENLENVFPRAGIGVFHYTPRGIGQSTGRWQRATLNDFADDAIAAVHFLSARKEVDGNRIGIAGLGEDGWVAQIVAATLPEQVKIMVSLAGPTIDPEQQLINKYHSEYVCAGQDSAVAHNKAVQKAASHQNWVSVLPLTKRWRHMKMKQNFDPALYIRDITIPSLFVFGGNDGNVYPEWSLHALNEIFPDSLPSNFSIHTIPGANHYFHVAGPCFDGYDDSGSSQRNFSFRFKEVFQNWIFENL